METPMRTVLAAESWNDIRAAYAAGADARALARQWGVSVSCIYRRAVSEGWAKRTRTVTDDPERDAYAPAHRQNAPKAADAPWRQDLMYDMLTGEMLEPGFLARLAIGASGEALRNYNLIDARSYLRLANDYARVAERCDTPNLHVVLRALCDREYADKLFAVEEGELNAVKDVYWTYMNEVDAINKARHEAAARADEAAKAEPAPAVPE
jgi:hypothetical protein